MFNISNIYTRLRVCLLMLTKTTNIQYNLGIVLPITGDQTMNNQPNLIQDTYINKFLFNKIQVIIYCSM